MSERFKHMLNGQIRRVRYFFKESVFMINDQEGAAIESDRYMYATYSVA